MSMKLMRGLLTVFACLWFVVSAAAQIIQPVCSFTNLITYNSPRNLKAGLALGPDGNFYGMTLYGGTKGYGTIFRVTAAGTLTVIANFDYKSGDAPQASLTLGPDGNFYGTTPSGGLYLGGTVFQVTTTGALRTIFSFHTAVWSGSGVTNTDGATPYASLTLGSDNCFYGTTSEGGMNGGGGTVFRITTNGMLTTLTQFGNPNGSTDPNIPGGAPYGRMAFGPDGNLYGTTFLGGYQGNGTVFKMTTNGAFTTLVRFGETNGSEPEGDLTLGPDGNLYGTTLNGGAGGDGTVFKMTTNGVLTTIIPFDYRAANTPMAGLTLGPDGYLYGTLAEGNPPNTDGAIFRTTTNGTWTILANFAGTNGHQPEAPLTLGPDGNFYGTTFGGGNTDPNAAGAVYRVNITPVISNQVLAILMNANGVMTLNCASTPGSTNRLWVTTNPNLPMSQWQVIATNIATNGVFQFVDPDTGGKPMKFYRVSTP